MRRLQPPAGKDKKSYTKERLLPTLEHLLKYTGRDDEKDVLDFTKGGLRDFVNLVFHLYITHVVGSAPAGAITERDITSTSCGCDHCELLTQQLLGEAQSANMARAKPIRDHLERQLKSAPAGAWGMTWTTTTEGTPYTLSVSHNGSNLA